LRQCLQPGRRQPEREWPMVGEIEVVLHALNRARVRYPVVGGVAVVLHRAIRLPLEKTEATVIALEDLITLKRSVARPRDLEDVTALESLREADGHTESHSDG
jgi:hypothetical protein